MKKNLALSKDDNSILLSGRFNVDYSTSKHGIYFPYIRFSLYRPMAISDFVSYIRRNLIGSPTWVRSHVSSELRHWSACFWFRFLTSVGYFYFPVEISSSDLNFISRREAAL